MSKPGSKQKKPAVCETAETDTGADLRTYDGNPESFAAQDVSAQPRESGGPAGPEPTRYGDWERKGRCIDF